MKKPLLLILSLTFVTSFLFSVISAKEPFGSHATFLTEYIPEKYRGSVQQTLRSAGRNALELMKVFENITPEKYEAAAFVLAYLDLSRMRDAQRIKADVLIEDIEFAFKARELFPYARNFPGEYFYYYILPHRVTQEPIEKWRKFFFEELKEKFKKIESLETAALELNKWCGSKVKFKQTSPADQTPLETLRKGYGRCEEESIFYMAAARALLIPARYVYVPYWSTCDGNHAWIEVYTDDGWKYLGACEPAETLNQAWFTNPVRRAPIVLAKVIGRPPQDTKEEIYRQSNREVILNVTHVYAKTCKVKVKVMGSNGGLVRGIPVYFNIFNFGSLQPIAVFRTDKNGQGSIALGLGDFVLTTGTVKQFAWQKISTVPDGQLKIELRLKDLEKAVPEGSFWLRYPKPKK